MKCVKDSKGSIKVVRDEEASELVDSGDYIYCSRSEWKKEVRNK